MFRKSLIGFFAAAALLLAACFSAAAASALLVIPDHVERIEAEAFYGDKSLQEVVLPDSLRRIGTRAFSRSSVKRMYMPPSLSFIADNAFENCSGLVCYGERGTYAEQYCLDHQIPFERPETDPSFFTVLELNDTSARITGYSGHFSEVYVPEEINGKQITEIGANAFNRNAEAVTVSLPLSVVSVGSSAFANCSSLIKVYMPSVTAIGGSAFEACQSMTNISWLPSALKTIGDSAFANCPNLQTAYLPDSVETLGRSVFRNDAELMDFHFPLSWAAVDYYFDDGYIFSGCKKLTRIVIPDGVTAIPNHAFAQATYLTEVVIPDSVEEIKGNAFYGCMSLASIDFPASLKTIHGKAFYGCKSITNIDGMPSTLTWIRDSAFENCTSLKTANLPDSVKTLGRSVFKGDVELESFRYPFNWESVDSYYDDGYIFSGCKKLTRIVIPNGVTFIPNHAFAQATYLTEVVIPDSVEEIKGNAFYGCTSLASIDFPASLKTIHGKAFYGCKSITNIDGMPSTLTWIRDSAFENCTSLKTANLPDSVKTLGRSVFRGDVELESFRFPFNWQSVDSYYDDGYIFYGCQKLTRIVIPDGVTAVPNHAFAQANYLQEVEVPLSVTAIKPNAFYACTSLQKVYLSPAVTSIGNKAFYNCGKLITWCEYDSYAYNYMVNNGINYYYLTPDGIPIPSGSIYEGEGALYGTARAECSSDESVVLTRIQATIWKDGSVYRQKTVTPNTNECSMSGAFHTALALYTLPLGSYRFTLTARTPWSSEVWADSSFTVVEKKPVFTFRETYGNPTFVPGESTFQLFGEITCNFDITDLVIFLRHLETKTDTRLDYSINPKRVVRFQTTEQNAVNYLPGSYTVYIGAQCVATGDQWYLVHEFDMSIASSSTIDSSVREELLAYLDDDSDPWSFKEYSVKLGDYLATLNTWDMICMAWSDFTGQTRSYLQDLLSGSDVRTYQVELIKADVADLLQDMFDRNELPDLSSAEPEWLKQLKTDVGAVNAVFDISDKELDTLRNKWVIDYDHWKVDKGAKVFEKDLKTFGEFKDMFSKIGKEVKAMGKTVKYSKAMMGAICELYTDHYRDLEMLRMLYEAHQGDAEYQQAILELTQEYSSRQSAAMSVLCKQLVEYAKDELWDAAEEVILDSIGEVASGYLSLGKICAEVLLKVSGVTDHGENWQEFYHRFSSQKVIAQLYQQSVWDIKVAISNNKPVTDAMIQKVQSLFIATRTATARCFDTLAKLDYQYKMRHTSSARNVRAKVIPGVPAEEK